MADTPQPKAPKAAGVQISSRLKGLIRKNETVAPVLETRAAATASTTTARPAEIEAPVQKRGLLGTLVTIPEKIQPKPPVRAQEKPVTVSSTAAEDFLLSKSVPLFGRLF